MPRIAHGEVVTPEPVQNGQKEAASSPDSGLAMAAAGSGGMRAYNFMFRGLQNDKANLLPRSPHTLQHLKALGREMIDPASPPAPGTGDTGDSDIPSAYTYFGQFVDHDITMEGSPFSPVDLFSPTMVPLSLAQIRQLKNLHRPTLDLDSVYGPTSPPGPEPPRDSTDPDKMKIGKVTRLGVGEREQGDGRRVRLKGDDNDLPRLRKDHAHPRLDRAARIGDPRNDENLIISQLHVAFLKAHNALVDQEHTFGQARRLLRRHYQHVVIHDFLKRVADPAIVDDILQNGNRVYDPPAGRFFLPLEFTVAAYRFGHSMVREKYAINLNSSGAALFMLFDLTAFSGSLQSPGPSAPDHNTLPDNWIIEWQRFADTLDTKAPNRARQINTKLVEGLFGLPLLGGSSQDDDLGRLPVRNLLRGYRLRLPTGQAVARRLGLPVLTPSQIETAAADPGQVLALRDGGFLERTPLWYYLLAEAAHPSGGNGQRLGQVGSTIVAEVLIGLVRRSADSILKTPGWQPSLPSAHPGSFELADLLRFAGVLPRTYKARSSDSLPSIAADQLGDAGRWTEIFVLNRGSITHRDRISAGQVFLLPGDTPPPKELRPVLHTFQGGDTLWDLAEKFLGDQQRSREIQAINADVLGAGPVVPPGTQLVILPP